jgi:hypothetical protein
MHLSPLPCSDSFNQTETLSTVRFGSRAKNIKNKPKVNMTRSLREVEGLLEASEKQVCSAHPPHRPASPSLHPLAI